MTSFARSLVNSLRLKVFVVLNQSKRSVIQTKTLKGRLPHRNQHHFYLSISMRVPAVSQYQHEGSSCFYKHQHKLGFQLCLNISVRAPAVSKERNKNEKKERKKRRPNENKQKSTGSAHHLQLLSILRQRTIIWYKATVVLYLACGGAINVTSP